MNEILKAYYAGFFKPVFTIKEVASSMFNVTHSPRVSDFSHLAT
uniref:Uncharacterized protein n=1 Tax=Anguilla anguilla TaxID=7936 RepID=A0A0E9Y0G2_ANGAN